jgi:aldehyde:ferredoxin oxidoreductase
MYGWQGAILVIDLTNGKITKKPLDPQVAEQFLGGRGLNSKTLFDLIKPGIDPLGPENVLCLANGPLAATPLGLTSRLEVSTLSPYSGILGDGNAGGGFAAALKRAGYDQIIILGRAPEPTYLWIDDDQVELVNAAHLWGGSTWETTDRLRETHGQGISVAAIGQGGENLVRFASTIVDKYASAARGSGAVFGSKNLKAIAVRGTRRVTLADPKTYAALAAEERHLLRNDPIQKEVSSVYGSLIGTVQWQPGVRNYTRYLKATETPTQLRPENWKRFEIRRTGCQSCFIRCKNVFEIPTGERRGERGEGLEYEAIFCMGLNCGIEDPIAIMEMANLGDAYGMCVVALGNTLAFLKDCFRRGIITTQDTGGLQLDWENAAHQIELVHRTALREGFGNVVAEGLFNTARLLGPEAMAYCYHVKGLSRGPHPAGFYSLAHATSTRGADHLRGRTWSLFENEPQILEYLEQAGAVPTGLLQNPPLALKIAETACTLADALGRCKGAVNSWNCAVPLVSKYHLWNGYAKLLTAATGVEFTSEKLVAAADRIYAVERAFNVQQGITRRDDGLPQKPEIKSTPEGQKERELHEELLTAYYRLRDYDLHTGLPTREGLERLGLGYVAAALEANPPVQPWQGPTLWPLADYPHGGRRA